MMVIRNLHKKFGRLKVLNGLNLTLEQGKISAIIGPNGSGKTTLIKCLLGLVKADQGSITVSGQLLNEDWRYKKMIGYMPQWAHFPENLTVREIISMIKDLRNEEKKWDEELYTSFNLDREVQKKIRTLSGGTKQKVGAYLAFLFYPQILVLDEPTAGLDPRASSLLKDKIIKEKAAGKTVIITSHIMSELQELADHIIFLLDGEVKFQGSVQNMMAESKTGHLERAVAAMMGRYNS